MGNRETMLSQSQTEGKKGRDIVPEEEITQSNFVKGKHKNLFKLVTIHFTRQLHNWVSYN